MVEKNVVMLSGGTAEWEQQLPIGNGIRAVGYRANLLTRLSTDDGDMYLRTIFIGMDKVRPDEAGDWGDESGGFGHFQMEDIRSGDTLIGHIDWRVDAGQDYGTFTFDEGEGYWKGVTGAMQDVRLDWCVRESDGSIASGKPVTLLAFIEGRGFLSLAN